MQLHRWPARLTLAFGLTLSLAPFGTSFAQDTGLEWGESPALPDAGGNLATPATGRATMSPRQLDAETTSLRFLNKEFARSLGNAGIVRPEFTFRTKRVEEDAESRSHTHVQQLYRGVPVFGGEAIVHLNSNEPAPSMTDDLLRDVQADTTPTLSAADAERIATQAYGCESCLTSKPKTDLWVLRVPNRAPDALVYRVQLRREDGSDETAMPIFFVNAHDGGIEMNYNNLQSGTGSSLYSGTRTINTFYIYLNPSYPTFFLEDHIRNFAIYDGKNSTNSIANFEDLDNNFNASYQRAAVDAHFGTSKTLDYYKATFNRNGLDGKGGPAFHYSRDGVTRMKSVRVHYGVKLNNGFWNGNEIVLGDGDGVYDGPEVSVDWLGHEWTHALTQYTANLVYTGESGALNESFSDVFGCLIERYTFGENSGTWKIFEKTMTPKIAGDAARDMEFPHRGRNLGYTSDDQPDHYSERYKGTEDNGGVHINSGISNKAFHLLAKGGSHHKGGSMTGIGPDKSAKIWYKALTAYMTKTTNFKGARTATLNAAKSLYGSGSVEYTAVGKAWTLVGVL